MNDSNRVEAFSDGVMAIAITLLVLDLRVPVRNALGGQSLAAALAEEWPSYAAYLVSFVVIGIIWINHHAMFSMVARVDRAVLFANLALLLTITVLPFPTHLFAEYLTAGRDARTAALIYSVNMLAMSVTFAVLWLAITREVGILHPHLDVATGRAALRRFAAGLVFYAATVGLAFVNAYAVLAVDAALAIYYGFDQLGSKAASDAKPR